MGNTPGQPLYETDDCNSTTSRNDLPITANQIQILLNSPFATNIFLRGSKIISDRALPIEINKRWYFWDNYHNSTNGNWNKCSVPLTPKTWFYSDGSSATTINYGCNLIETCCEASCCRLTTLMQAFLIVSFFVTMYFFLIAHLRLRNVVNLLTRYIPQPSSPRIAPSAPRLSAGFNDIRPSTISQRRQSPLYLQVPASDVQTPSVRNIPLPSPISPESTDEEEGIEEIEDGEPPKKGYHNTIEFINKFFKYDMKERYFETKYEGGQHLHFIRNPKDYLDWNGRKYYWDKYFRHHIYLPKICFYELKKSWHADLRNIHYENGSQVDSIVFSCPPNNECCSFGCCEQAEVDLVFLFYVMIFIVAVYGTILFCYVLVIVCVQACTKQKRLSWSNILYEIVTCDHPLCLCHDTSRRF